MLFSVILLANLTSYLHSSMEWGWRENLNVDVITSGHLLKTINTHNLHRDMYELEVLVAPYVKYSDHPANICMGAITLFVQCSSDVVCCLTIPITNEEDKRIIFCSQKAARLHPGLTVHESISFSPKDSHPKDDILHNFLTSLGHPKLNYSSSKKYIKTEGIKNEATSSMYPKVSSSLKRSSDADSESGKFSTTSSVGFRKDFQHTEQKLVYYLFKNNAKILRDHIHCALVKIYPTASDNFSLYYNNIVGLILHVHTRLDVCENCNDSLVLFRKNALSILNTPPEDYISFATEGTAGIAMTSAAQEDIAGVVVDSVFATSTSTPSSLPIIDAPVLVTVSSRARNDTNREIAGYDEHWEGSNDKKMRGHINLLLKPAEKIVELTVGEVLEGIEVININPSSTLKKGVSSAVSAVDYTYPAPNCHSIFPDVLQRFAFKLKSPY